MGVANISGNILTDSGASLSSYLPLTGGTLTGAATFNSTSNQIILQNTDGGTNAEKVGLFMTGGDYFKLISLNDNNTTRVDNILVANVLTGNVGIGTSSPTAWNGNQGLLVSQTGTGNTNTIYSLQSGATSVDTGSILEGFSTNTTSGSKALGSIVFLRENTSTTALSSYTAFYTNNAGTVAERMRITSGGNVGIGTSSPNAKLNVVGNNSVFLIDGGGSSVMYQTFNSSGGNYYIGISSSTGAGLLGGQNAYSMCLVTESARDMSFGTSNTERMRITSGGKVLIGTSSVISGNYMVQASGNGGFVTNASNSGDSSYYSVTGTVGWHFYAEGGGSTKMYVLQNGDVRNANNSYGAISDISLKENITDATPKLADLLKVKVRNYNLIADENKEKQIGVIAQELEEVFPNMISEDKQMGSKETIKTVKYSVFVPMLIKAMQEQQEIINQLSAKVTALENK